MRTRAKELRKHLEYIVPQIRLVMLKEPGVKAKCITMPGEVERFVEPLKFHDVEHFISLIKAGELMNIPVLDHIIVAATGIRSIREFHPNLWS